MITPVFRVSYPNVFKPRFNKLNNKMEYSIEALFDKNADLSGLKKAAEEACVKEFGPDKTKWPKKLRSPFKDQADKAKEVDGKEVLADSYTRGAMFLSLKSNQKPGLVNQSTEDIIDETEFYAGCYARAYVTCYAYNQVGNAGVNFGLQHIQKVKEGDPLGSRVKVEDAFSPVDTENSGEAKDATSVFN